MSFLFPLMVFQSFISHTVLYILIAGNILYMSCFSSNTSLKLVALGDWGGLPIFPYRTFVELSVGKGMAEVASKVGVDAVIALGDNFYLNGVKSVEDKRFIETFEMAFNYKSLDIPWLVVAGNHDHYGNVSAQIAYTYKSNRWYFPNYYYVKSFKLPFSNKTVDVLMVDTVILCGNVASDDSSNEPVLDSKYKITSIDHWKWLEYNLRTSRASYLLVCGHYPVYSIGTHGPTKCLVEQLEPIMKKYKVTAYFSGHDHSIQHIQVVHQNDVMDYIVSGSANIIDPSKKNLDKIPVGSLKFHWANPFSLGAFSFADFTDSKMTIYFVYSNGSLMYKISKPPRYL